VRALPIWWAGTGGALARRSARLEALQPRLAKRMQIQAKPHNRFDKSIAPRTADWFKRSWRQRQACRHR
jgi:hypothetical protein